MLPKFFGPILLRGQGALDVDSLAANLAGAQQ